MSANGGGGGGGGCMALGSGINCGAMAGILERQKKFFIFYFLKKRRPARLKRRAPAGNTAAVHTAAEFGPPDRCRAHHPLCNSSIEK
jgi:hypothetical protein